ncbi:MAG TPA: 50S ribosomal protein L23 [Gammaproteobacteria bacterium]|nr:50S ribosomal protein L23 [Gammaproteobacteria bacterium]
MNQERLLKILLAPHVSEKATIVAENHKQFVFQVAPDATKPEIKAAVEQLFEVEVAGVQIVNLKGKTKRFGATMGRRNNLKKAYVALKPGFDIDFMGAQ